MGHSVALVIYHPADTNNNHLQTFIACQGGIRLFQRRLEVKRVQEYMRPSKLCCELIDEDTHKRNMDFLHILILTTED